VNYQFQTGGSPASSADNNDLDGLRAALLDSLESLAETLLGKPSIRKPRSWRWGRKGSLALELHGRKRGSWKSYETDEGGGPFQLIMYARRCSLVEAIDWAREWTGSRPALDDAALRERMRKQAEVEAKKAGDEGSRIAHARRLWEGASAVAGTVADLYLTGTRGIPRPATGWPDAVRFHYQTCSLILAATMPDGAVQAVQRVYLTSLALKISEEAAKQRKLPQSAKRSNGVLAGVAVRLPGAIDGPLLLAEGPETGLSVWAATGHETWIALGTLANLVVPSGRTVVVCRDDDKRFSPTDRKLTKTIQEWRKAGIDIRVATPWPERRHDKSDFNDAMKVGGPAEVKARIDAVLTPIGPGRPRLPMTEARQALDSAMSRFFDVAEAHDLKRKTAPPVHAMRVDVGTGKSRAARQRAAKVLAGMRARGDKRTVVFAVPTHKLADEQASEFERLPEAAEARRLVRCKTRSKRAIKAKAHVRNFWNDISGRVAVRLEPAPLKVAIWRGREAPDPTAPGETMCRDIERVRDAQTARVSVQSAVCKRKLEDDSFITCPFFDVCGYQRQRERKADLWIVAHEMLFTQKPAAIGKVAAVIVDESAWQDGLEGVNGEPITLALDTLQATDKVPGDPISTDRLIFLRRRLYDALHQMSDGPVIREIADIGCEAAAEAHKIEWMRKVDPGMHPGMTAAERKAAVKAAEGNRTIFRLAMLWHAVETLVADDGPETSGWAELALEHDAKGSVRVVRLKGRKRVREGWQAPTLLIDAILDLDLVRPFWPQAELTADVAAATPHQRVSQVVDVSFSKRRLVARDDAPEEDQKRRSRKCRDLHAFLATIGRDYAPYRVLVVAQQAIEQILPTVGLLPPNIELAHHNAVAGRDEWKDVACLTVVGRTAPPPGDVERLAEALTGRVVPIRIDWYSRACITRELADGVILEAEADRHSDPIAEAIRWQICEGELVQIIGRARGVNRTEANPVDVLVLTDVPLPMPVGETLFASDLTPTPVELMLSAGGIAFENPTDAAAAYPSLWDNREAAKKALQRFSLSQSLGTNPYKYLLIRKCPQPRGERDPYLRRVEYQVAKPGGRLSTAWYDPALIRDPAAELAKLLGPLSWCHVIAGETIMDRDASHEPAPDWSTGEFSPKVEFPWRSGPSSDGNFC
jgi:putative DNA primase/helicase